MQLYNTTRGPVLELDGALFHLLDSEFDSLVNHPDPRAALRHLAAKRRSAEPIAELDPRTLLAPIGNQEIWAAGGTYAVAEAAPQSPAMPAPLPATPLQLPAMPAPSLATPPQLAATPAPSAVPARSAATPLPLAVPAQSTVVPAQSTAVPAQSTVVPAALAARGAAGASADRGCRRPRLFFKSSAHRVSGPAAPIRIRADSRDTIPEPELALVINLVGHIVGLTIANDVTARDLIETDPRFLCQAKVYDQCCALGPGILIGHEPLDPSTRISIEVRRGGEVAFAGETALERMIIGADELIEWLFRDNTFPAGVILLTGNGVTIPPDFALRKADEVRIEIPPIGSLSNPVR